MNDVSTKRPAKRPANKLKTDTWVWGNEGLIWGYDPSHQYTFKVLEPKVGREGCLSLQYHHRKSETWFVLQGLAWALLIVGDKVCTRIMGPRDIQNIHPGTIHRVTSIEPGTQILEPSTPDRHAADKKVKKDVVRLHCVHGRPVFVPPSPKLRALVAEAVEITEEALEAIERGDLPREYRTSLLKRHGAFVLPPGR
jgi:mannose-6-phosphate isomerase-like protein (cupin superfamily)